MRKFLKRPSPAMVVALVALFFSLAGNAMAAVLITNSSQIRDGAVTGADLANNTVRSADVQGLTAADLAPGSVAASELANNTVTNLKLALAAVQSQNLAAGAVGSPAIADDGVTATDLAAGSVGTSEITDGTVGGADVATNTLNYGNLRVRYQDFRDFNYAGVINNNTCSAPQPLQALVVAEASFMTVGSYTIVTLNTLERFGWEIEGLTTTVAGNAYVRICNYTGANADPPNAGINTLTIHG
jgi:hypothetical protein